MDTYQATLAPPQNYLAPDDVLFRQHGARSDGLTYMRIRAPAAIT